MDCVVIAGGRPDPDDPLFTYTEGKPKALLSLNGQPMLAHVLQALNDACQVDTIVVVGMIEEEGAAAIRHLPASQPVIFLADQGSIVANARRGLEWLEANRPGNSELLLSTADIPLLTGEIVDAFVEQCRPFDRLAYYNMVTKETMEARFPHSNRTFVRLREAEVAGGDLFLAQSDILYTNQALWEALTNARKHAWQLARIVGFRTLFKLLLHRLSLAEVEQLATQLLGAPIRILTSPYPELAMDADKPEQVDLLRRQLSGE